MIIISVICILVEYNGVWESENKHNLKLRINTCRFELAPGHAKDGTAKELVINNRDEGLKNVNIAGPERLAPLSPYLDRLRLFFVPPPPPPPRL